MFNVPQKAEDDARKAKEEEEKRKKKEEERARRRARGLEDEEEKEQEEGEKEGEEDEEQKEGEQTEEEQHREPGEIIKGFYYGKPDKFWVSMVSFSLLVQSTSVQKGIVWRPSSIKHCRLNKFERMKCFTMFENMFDAGHILSNTVSNGKNVWSPKCLFDRPNISRLSCCCVSIDSLAQPAQNTSFEWE